MFNRLKFVVASTPRSATRYITAVLNKAGILTTHELLCKDCHCWWGAFECPIIAEVSWLLPPRLDKMPSEIILLHQIRHPVPTINSIIRTHHMEPTKTRNTRWLFGPATEKLGLHRWPGDALGRAIYFWCEWHKAILEKSKCTPNYYRYQIETVLAAELSLVLHGATPVDVQPFLPRLQRALTDVAKDYNVAGRRTFTIGWDDLTTEAKELAGRFGYNESIPG